jgi:ribosomal protein L40E
MRRIPEHSRADDDGTDETGKPYATRITHYALCVRCGAQMPVRALGRTPRYCGPTCRVAANRAERKVNPRLI